MLHFNALVLTVASFLHRLACTPCPLDGAGVLSVRCCFCKRISQLHIHIDAENSAPVICLTAEVAIAAYRAHAISDHDQGCRVLCMPACYCRSLASGLDLFGQQQIMPAGWLVPSEVHDLNTRSAGQSITVFVQLGSGAIVTQCFLSMMCSMKYGVCEPPPAAPLLCLYVIVYSQVPCFTVWLSACSVRWRIDRRLAKSLMHCM